MHEFEAENDATTEPEAIAPEPDTTQPEPRDPEISSPDERPDPRLRPPDPAGTQPRVEPDSLLPASNEPLLRSPAADVDADAEEVPLDEGDESASAEGDLLPSKRPSGAPALAAASGPSPHAGRFGFALGALLAIAAAGMVLAVVVIGDRNNTGPVGPAWSKWTPVKDGGDSRVQIAGHVGSQYRLLGGRQLVAVKATGLKVSGVDLDIAKVGASSKDDIKLIKGDKTVMYRMCGLNPACSIPGEPSVNRGLLVRREALELAMYTFKYTDANGVVVVLPPAVILKKGQKTPTAADLTKANENRIAAYFSRGDLKKTLSGPVTATLAPNTPSVASISGSPDVGIVKTLVEPSIYKFSLTSGNTDDTGYLVLSKQGV